MPLNITTLFKCSSFRTCEITVSSAALILIQSICFPLGQRAEMCKPNSACNIVPWSASVSSKEPTTSKKGAGSGPTNDVGGPRSLGLGAHAGARSFVRWGCKSSRVASRPRLASSPRPPRHLARIHRLVSVQRPTTGSAWNFVPLPGECERSSEREFFGV